MEMLQAKQEQEKKRLREQMEAEAAVQRQQMENMVKARMIVRGKKLCILALGQILYLFIGLDPVLYFVRSFTRPVER